MGLSKFVGDITGRNVKAARIARDATFPADAPTWRAFFKGLPGKIKNRKVTRAAQNETQAALETAEDARVAATSKAAVGGVVALGTAALGKSGAGKIREYRERKKRAVGHE